MGHGYDLTTTPFGVWATTDAGTRAVTLNEGALEG